MPNSNKSLRCCLTESSYITHLPLSNFIIKSQIHNSTHPQQQLNSRIQLQQKSPLFQPSNFIGKMEKSAIFENDLNLEATELRLGLPGRDESSTNTSIKTKKRNSSEMDINSSIDQNTSEQDNIPPPSKAQVVGWPPVRSYRKNALQQKKTESDISSVMFVKVSMDGAPYLRKIDLKGYRSYQQLLKALENMFKCGTFGAYSEREGYYGSEFAPTYEDKDGDWMLVGDVPWDMFVSSCKRLRITKGSEAKGLGCSS